MKDKMCLTDVMLVREHVYSWLYDPFEWLRVWCWYRKESERGLYYFDDEAAVSLHRVLACPLSAWVKACIEGHYCVTVTI